MKKKKLKTWVKLSIFILILLGGTLILTNLNNNDNNIAKLSTTTKTTITTTTKKEESNELSMVMVGDCLIHRFVYTEANNNDGSTKLNKATFSSELVYKLLLMYANKDTIVYDCFMGTGTTAIGCLKYGCNYIGSEINTEQYNYSINRIKKMGY